jgi:hypothetical protein
MMPRTSRPKRRFKITSEERSRSMQSTTHYHRISKQATNTNSTAINNLPLSKLDKSPYHLKSKSMTLRPMRPRKSSCPWVMLRLLKLPRTSSPSRRLSKGVSLLLIQIGTLHGTYILATKFLYADISQSTSTRAFETRSSKLPHHPVRHV